VILKGLKVMRHSCIASVGILLVVSAATVSACGTQHPSPSPTVAADAMTNHPNQTASLTPASAATEEEPTAQTIVSAQEDIAPDGPWLAFATDSALWIANADGSGSSRVTGDYPRITAPAAAISGGHAAFVTAGKAAYSDLQLHIIDLPSGKIRTITSLTSAATAVDPTIQGFPGNPNLEIARAILDVPSLAWSPDGAKLAFIGAMDGPSADLYVYSLADGSIMHFTDNPSQGYRPTWSPDGKIVVHAGAGSFGTGAGYVMVGVWAAMADGSGVKTLYESDSSDEIFAGWISDSAFLVYSWSACGTYNLRAVDAESGEVHPVWEGAFFTQTDSSGIAYDPATGAVLLSLDEYAAQATCTAGAQPQKAGLYLTNVNRPRPVYISDQTAFSPFWNKKLGLFFARTDDGGVQVTIGGAVASLVAPTSATPIISPDGASWAWIGDGFAYKPAGLWIGSAARRAPTPIVSDTVYRATWAPDGQHLFFFTDRGLYVTDRKGSRPVLLASGVRPSGKAVWVMP
jgi:WD40 repeat protein